MNIVLRYVAIGGFLFAGACTSTSTLPPDLHAANEQMARQEVFTASAAVAGIAASVLSAHSVGLIQPGPVEKDIQAGLDSARYSLDKANVSLHSNPVDAGAALFYANQVGDLLAALKKQLLSLGMQA